MAKKVDAVLSPNFVEEMLRLAFSNKKFAILVTDNLDISNFPREMGSCKAMLKVLLDNMRQNGSLATFGMVEMAYPNNAEITKKIEEVKNTPMPDYDVMVGQLESFIRKHSFVSMQNEVVDMYNEGRVEEAMAYLEKRIVEINGFSLEAGSGKFNRVYRDFYQNIGTAQLRAEDEMRRQNLPFGMTSLDDITDGGVPRGDTALWIMMSGVGKSTVLKYIGWYNTSIAHNHVLHVQLEGGRDEAVVKYDQMVANTTYSQIMRGDLSPETKQRVAGIIKRALTVNSDIDVYASDEMMDSTVADIVAVTEDYYKLYGYYPDLVLVDSLDLLLTGENKKVDYDPNFIKYRLQKCAQRLKDYAKKYDCAVMTATQTGDIPFEFWNDPSFVITRHNTEGDRTLVKPFSFVFSGNMTIEEKNNRVARIFFDKLRNYKNNGIIVRIPTNYENGFFYDISRSVAEEKILDTSALEKPAKRAKKQDQPVAAEPVDVGNGTKAARIPKKSLTVKVETDNAASPANNKDSLKSFFNKLRQADEVQ